MTTTTLAQGVGLNDLVVRLASGVGVFVRYVLVVEQEQMRVLSLLPGTTNVFNVLRGDSGTHAAAHDSGVSVDVLSEGQSVPIALAPVPPIVTVEFSGTSPSRKAELQVKDGADIITVVQVTY